ncbi:hypothetical protein GUITHDRAFT_102072 [Guillardia theta CCMP2712]|uniref:Aspartyl/asparaginy/proline hydroxylase domain-containing protein n=1 Tax=Guillardia theta (strain CCMP2712) TaxID=905079 RepID=L1JVD6_GUITC|nr:hypothetical protein GUITHDRAFT_102072 [Guillardia theta CCMP2712]EKX52170.1 hypothetical protein GUITHDRAFT_102072 [Guillardia theta CCMP2712]|eukprot:XP_005839150.1 hypothetical protein GUITHDRAFT_102072 [Guillardia theta CCMP2712]
MERKTEDDRSDSSDEEETEEYSQLWQKVEKVFEEFHLSPFAMAAAKKWVKLMADPSKTNLTRIRDWLLLRINNKHRAPPASRWQKGCPDLVPGLRALPFWDRGMPEMGWVREIEDHFEDVKEELLNLRGKKGFQPFRQPKWSTKLASDDVGAVSHDKGDWNVFYLFLHNEKFEENCAKCPKTVELIERIAPRQYKHAFFSALNPGTHVIAHTGPTNKKLRCHLPVTGVEGSRLRVADEVREQEEGVCYVFDDSFEHEAWHDGTSTRIVLIFDVWHPDFSDEEVKFLGYLQKSQMKEEQRMSAGQDSEDNFYSLLRKTKDLLVDDSWWIAPDEASAHGRRKHRVYVGGLGWMDVSTAGGGGVRVLPKKARPETSIYVSGEPTYAELLVCERMGMLEQVMAGSCLRGGLMPRLFHLHRPCYDDDDCYSCDVCGYPSQPTEHAIKGEVTNERASVQSYSPIVWTMQHPCLEFENSKWQIFAEGESSWSGLARDINAKDKVAIYVASSGTGEIVKLVDQGDGSAQIVQKIPTGGVPSSLAFDEVGAIFVGDIALKCILSHPPEDSEFQVLVSDYEGQQFFGPNSLCFDSNGTLFFTDSGPMGDTSLSNPKGSVFCVSSEDQLLKPLAVNCLAHPSGIAVSPDGSCVYVAETMANRILRFIRRPTGVYMCSVFHTFSGGFGPTSLACDSKSNLYVCRWAS